MFLLYFQCLSKGKITFIMQLGGHQYSNDIQSHCEHQSVIKFKAWKCFSLQFYKLPLSRHVGSTFAQQQLMSILARTSPAVGKNGKPRLVSKVMTGLTLHSLLHYITHTTNIENRNTRWTVGHDK